MLGKLKLMWLVIGCLVLATANGQAIMQSKTPRLLIIGDGVSGNSDNEYEVLRVFIANYSDDTLKYWGTTHLTKFFTVSFNQYMHLVDGASRDSAIEVIKIPPHRSQLIPLRLLVSKQPIRNVRISVWMNFYSYSTFGRFEEDIKDRKPIKLKDNITLRYKKDGSHLYKVSDMANEEKKARLKLPTIGFYLLTNDERKLYTVTADQNKITTKIATGSSFAGRKIFLVPVTVHNESNEPLKYYSMSCSWMEFYQTNIKNFDVFGADCIGNMPDIVVVQPHSTHTDTVPLIAYKKHMNMPLHFKIGLHLNKIIGKPLFAFDYDDLTSFNLAWSNEIQINK